MPELRLGLVGCGRLAERGYIEAIRRARGVRLSALADPEESRCRRLAADVPVYRDAAELASDGAADAVIVASPAWTHLECARSASAAGLPALVEKPPAAGAEEAEELALLDPPPVFGFNRRFEPGMDRLRTRIRSSDELELSLTLHHRGGWDPYTVTDDALTTLAPHLVDLARWLPDAEVVRARAIDVRPLSASVDLELSRGRARISVSTDRDPQDIVDAREGSRLQGRRIGGGVLRRGARRLRRPLGAGALVRSLALQLEEFSSSAKGGRGGRLASAADGLAVMRVLDAVDRSKAAGGEWSQVSDGKEG